MTLNVQMRNKVAVTCAVDSYHPVLKVVHWASLIFVIAAYTAVWMSHAAASSQQSAVLVQLHRSIGVTVFLLTLFRLAWRWNSRVPRLPSDLPLLQKVAARTTEYAFYMLLLLQPALGLLHTNARGQRIDLYFLGELPAVIGPDKAWAKQLMTAHEFVAYLLLGLIGLHAAAALFHHFVRRDNVLIAMLPGRSRQAFGA
jgi:superoxide oxidase